MKTLTTVLFAILMTLAAFAAPTVTDVVAKQRYPWNGLVDITCKVEGMDTTVGKLKFVVSAVMPNTGVVVGLKNFWVLSNGEKSAYHGVSANGDCRLLWDAKADLGEVRHNNMVVRITLEDMDEKVQLWEDGPYWATTNIGAEKPEDYGYYFWWGDTIGYKRENNKWVASDGSNSNFSFTEGNTPTYYKNVATLQSQGWITSDSVLASEHDAAQKHWGGDWRMPTKQEFDDLDNKCDWTWSTVNGVNGYVVSGKGDYAFNSIFLPCAGSGYGTSLLSDGSFGNYWSSVPDSDGYGDYSWTLDFDSGHHFTTSYFRDDGQSVRPVLGASCVAVTFDACGGSSVDSISVPLGQSFGDLPIPTREGYVFVGWFTAASGGTQVTANTTASVSMTTLYAQWEKVLSDTLDIENMEVLVGGNVEWFGQTDISHDAVDAAQSGYISDDQTSWMQVVVKDVSSVSFWWKVSSESDCDKLHFYVDGTEVVDPISGYSDWIKVEYKLAAGSHTLKWEYTKDGSVSNGDDCGWVDSVVLSQSQSHTLSGALDIENIEVLVGGNVEWFGQTDISHDAVDAAQSGYISDDQTSWMQVVVKDVSSVSFWWKVSSEEDYDELHFYVDGTEVVDPISGQPDWIKVEYALTAGSHTLKWEYIKDGSVSDGDDCGWVDSVVLSQSQPQTHEKVQLWEGGPYWATTNIGAEKPEDYGYCFWWGDTIGYKRENDKWVASDGSTSNFSFERGNTPTFGKGNSQLQSEGWITSDGVLALEHDAAHVHWGDDWRMPTKQEIEDLNSKCDWTWTTMNGVNGYVVRGKGDYASNSIFLPCVGTADMTSILYLGLDGGYWSSEPNPNYFGGGYASWYIFFNSSGAEVSYRNCWNGAYVRPLQGFTK